MKSGPGDMSLSLQGVVLLIDISIDYYLWSLSSKVFPLTLTTTQLTQNVGSMFVQRLGRWANIKPKLAVSQVLRDFKR